MSSFSAAARQAAPAVVSVTARRRTNRGDVLGEDPWFRFFRGERDAEIGLGSGVVVAAEGYLLTNQHVIDGASDIDVRLNDGRESRAQVVGADVETDLAVLKIALTNLPSISFSNLEDLQIGDPVLAIGNPFNVGQTVTSGIVSALGRNFGLSPFEDFIQTDAAINPGNSGGALVDLNGALIGINTAIFSRTGGSMGIGFAIPADLARQVMDSLIKDGRVTRGWIGVEQRTLTPEIADNLQLPVKDGVLITGVLRDGPASLGGVRPGDVVIRVAGQPVTNTAQLLKLVARLKPGQQSTLAVQRGPQQLTIDIRVGQRPPALRRTQQ
jgi:Do/DeqQ family serine protease